jgi:NADPH-dependent glutamate synthase beta subunit-like oxidoreductase
MDKAVRPGKKAEDLVPCKEACPAHIDVPGYLRLVAAGKRDEANAVIREKVPFPGILGRVCIHPCEEKCRRGELNEPISICALKRYAADGERGLWKKNSKIAPDAGKKVAVIGSGPAGLTASFYLRKRGYSVSIFEARSKTGGMMRYGIPRYRLPDDLLDKEIGDILIQFRFQDESNCATVFSWPDHEEPISNWSHPHGRWCDKLTTAWSYGKLWRCYCLRS